MFASNPGGDQERGNECLPTNRILGEPPQCIQPAPSTYKRCTDPPGCGQYGVCTTTCVPNTTTVYGNVWCEASNGQVVGANFCRTLRGAAPPPKSASCSSDCSGYPQTSQGSYGGACPTECPP
jgi:hypothetical protein